MRKTLLLGCLLQLAVLFNLNAQNGWYVQIAAFDRQVASDYFAEYNNLMYVVDHNDIHRYYLGSFDSKDNAQGAQTKARGYGYNAVLVNLDELKKSCSATCGYNAEPVDMIMNLNSIFFDFDKSNLRSQSIAELDKLVNILNENPTYTTVLGAHTDAKGNLDYNKALSQRRANAAREYLISRGISANRISTKTFGENKPIARNALAAGEDTEQGRQLNRRVELSVLDAQGRVLNVVEEIRVPDYLKVSN